MPTLWKNSVISVFISVFFTFAAKGECSRPLVIAYSDWSRMGAIQVAPEKAYGLDYDLMQAIMAEAGCEVSNRFVPNKRIQEALKRGLIDGTMGASLTVPRQEYAWYTEPYRQEIMAMFMRIEDIPNFNPATMNDVAESGLRVGLGIGSWHGAKFNVVETTHEGLKSRLLYSDNFHIMFQWLIRNRSDITIMDIHHGYFLLEHTDLLDQIKPHSFLINSNDVHIMLSKESVSNADATLISEAVGRFKNTPKYHQILGLYSTE